MKHQLSDRKDADTHLSSDSNCQVLFRSSFPTNLKGTLRMNTSFISQYIILRHSRQWMQRGPGMSRSTRKSSLTSPSAVRSRTCLKRERPLPSSTAPIEPQSSFPDKDGVRFYNRMTDCSFCSTEELWNASCRVS